MLHTESKSFIIKSLIKITDVHAGSHLWKMSFSQHMSYTENKSLIHDKSLTWEVT